MKYRALMITESRDAESVSSSLNIDNLEIKGSRDLQVEMKVLDKNRIITRVHSNRIGTLINTLDDIIRCQIVAEGLIGRSKS